MLECGGRQVEVTEEDLERMLRGPGRVLPWEHDSTSADDEWEGLGSRGDRRRENSEGVVSLVKERDSLPLEGRWSPKPEVTDMAKEVEVGAHSGSEEDDEVEEAPPQK